MAKGRPQTSLHATLYDFRDSDIMHHIAESTNGAGVSAIDIADLIGLGEDGTRQVGIRLAWMKRYGMVAYDDKDHLWKLSKGGSRVIASRLLAPQFKVVDALPDESMIEVMAMVTSRFQRGETMLAHMLRREFMFGTQKR
jgi:hypothetical protein